MIAQILGDRVPLAGLRVAPGDDAAVLADGTTVTVDALVQGVHFDGRTPSEAVGWKTLAVSISDLAAMGATPAWAVLALSLPTADDDWVAGFARGLAAACRRWQVALVGGDTTRSPGPRVASLTLVGRVDHPITRAGACPGDRIWVTGTLGLAGLGWRDAGAPDAARSALHRPHPPLALGVALAESGLATAAMDLSDGLATDLPRLCRASGVGAHIDAAALPFAPALRDRPDRLALQVCGGEDYELLFTAAPAATASINALAASTGTRVTVVGRCTDARDVHLDPDGWPPALFSHFGSPS